VTTGRSERGGRGSAHAALARSRSKRARTTVRCANFTATRRYLVHGALDAPYEHDLLGSMGSIFTFMREAMRVLSRSLYTMLQSGPYKKTCGCATRQTRIHSSSRLISVSYTFWRHLPRFAQPVLRLNLTLWPGHLT